MEEEKLIKRLRKLVNESKEVVRSGLEERMLFHASGGHTQTFLLKDETFLIPELIAEGLVVEKVDRKIIDGFEISHLIKWLSNNV